MAYVDWYRRDMYCAVSTDSLESESCKSALIDYRYVWRFCALIYIFALSSPKVLVGYLKRHTLKSIRSDCHFIIDWVVGLGQESIHSCCCLVV